MPDGYSTYCKVLNERKKKKDVIHKIGSSVGSADYQHWRTNPLNSEIQIWGFQNKGYPGRSKISKCCWPKSRAQDYTEEPRISPDGLCTHMIPSWPPPKHHCPFDSPHALGNLRCPCTFCCRTRAWRTYFVHCNSTTELKKYARAKVNISFYFIKSTELASPTIDIRNSYSSFA